MRQAIVNYLADTGEWVVGLMLDGKVKFTRYMSNYHEIGSVISNWIINGYE